MDVLFACMHELPISTRSIPTGKDHSCTIAFGYNQETTVSSEIVASNNSVSLVPISLHGVTIRCSTLERHRRQRDINILIQTSYWSWCGFTVGPSPLVLQHTTVSSEIAASKHQVPFHGEISSLSTPKR